MGNCLTLCDLLAFDNGKDPRVLCHTCSIHPKGLTLDSQVVCSNGSILGSRTDDVRVHYQLGRELGRGQFGVIRLCTHKISGRRFACKSISKSKLTTPGDVNDVQREIEILQQLVGHPNIVALEDVYEDDTSVHLVMELCEGGELFDRIVEKKGHSEREAAEIFKILIEVVQFCHANGVIHRDLKPENILLSSSSCLKVADFGLAVKFEEGGEKIRGMAGSAYYIAPEVLEGEYGQEIDVWSAGVVLYVLLSGVPPFWDETEEGIFDAIRYGHLDLSSDPWPKCSAAAKDIIRGMLCSDVKRRLTPAQILSHEWIIKNTQDMNEEESPSPTLPLSSSWRSLPTVPSANSSTDTDADDQDMHSSSTTPFQSNKSLSFRKMSVGSNEEDSNDDDDKRCQTFDKWTSFTHVMEPTFSDFIAMVLSSIDDERGSGSGSGSEEVDGCCEYEVVRASQKRQTVIVTSRSKGKLLVVHDKENKRIGWKKVSSSDEKAFTNADDTFLLKSTPDLRHLLWSPCPPYSPK